MPRRRQSRSSPPAALVIVGVVVCCFVGAVLNEYFSAARTRPAPLNSPAPKATDGPLSKEPPRLAAELIDTSVVPFTNPSGREFVQLRARWKNTGNRPIRTVTAVIRVEDENGGSLIGDTGGRDYPIDAVAKDAPGVAPGETFTLPSGEGYLVPIQPAITRGTARYNVRIVVVREDGY